MDLIGDIWDIGPNMLQEFLSVRSTLTKPTSMMKGSVLMDEYLRCFVYFYQLGYPIDGHQRFIASVRTMTVEEFAKVALKKYRWVL